MTRAGLQDRCAISGCRGVRARLKERFIVAPCRVVYVTTEPGQFGFAYGTLQGHPEHGEEAFHVTKQGDGTVSCGRTRSPGLLPPQHDWAGRCPGQSKPARRTVTSTACAVTSLPTDKAYLWSVTTASKTTSAQVELSTTLVNQGRTVATDDIARLSPLIHEHINLRGRYQFTLDGNEVVDRDLSEPNPASSESDREDSRRQTIGRGHSFRNWRARFTKSGWPIVEA